MLVYPHTHLKYISIIKKNWCEETRKMAQKQRIKIGMEFLRGVKISGMTKKWHFAHLRQAASIDISALRLLWKTQEIHSFASALRPGKVCIWCSLKNWKSALAWHGWAANDTHRVAVWVQSGCQIVLIWDIQWSFPRLTHDAQTERFASRHRNMD